MAFDDTATRNKFQAPSGTSMLDFIAGKDEAGVIYGKTLTANGPTGKQRTRRDGASACKDALISMVMQGGSGGMGNTTISVSSSVTFHPLRLASRINLPFEKISRRVKSAFSKIQTLKLINS